MKMSFDVKAGDCEVDFYNEEFQTLERWFMSEQDVYRFRTLIKNEFGDANVAMEGYF